MKILVTGGAGYIGSHTVLELLSAGHEPVVLDDFSNASRKVLARLANLAKRDVESVACNILDASRLDQVFAGARFDAVIHLAGRKAAGESMAMPLPYYRDNVGGTACLLERMQRHGVRRLVFSSSAAVYRVAGPMDHSPRTETSPVEPQTPYGRTKHLVEQMLRDICGADPAWRVSVLRYFNAVGAHPSGMIGEAPEGVPQNLLPFVAQVAVGRRDALVVFGNDYPTPDGTCVRDYVHVVDLARAHLRALERLERGSGFSLHNLGAGRGHTVLEVVRAFERASGTSIPWQNGARRPGDPAVCVADPSLARGQLGWCAEHDLDRMCVDLWRWQSRHPNGFD